MNCKATVEKKKTWIGPKSYEVGGVRLLPSHLNPVTLAGREYQHSCIAALDFMCLCAFARIPRGQTQP